MRRTRIPGPALCCFGLLLWACVAPASALAEDKPWTEVQPGRGVDATQWTERSPGGIPRRRQQQAAQPDAQAGTDAAGQPLPTPEQAAKAAEQGEDGSQSAPRTGLPLVPAPGQPIPVRRRATASRSGGGGTQSKKLALIIGLSVGGALVLGGGAAAAAILLTRHTQPVLPLVTLP